MKAAKLGGVLLVADVVSGVVLGKSVLGLGKAPKAGEQRDWKEEMADRLLGPSEQNEVADPPPTAGAPNRVASLLARVSGKKAVPGLRFEEVLDIIASAYHYQPTTYRTGVGSPYEASRPTTSCLSRLSGLRPAN